MTHFSRLFRYCTVVITVGFLLSALALGVVFALFKTPFADFSKLSDNNYGKPSLVYDDKGVEWARFQLERRDPVSLSVIPKHTIQAFIAAEDWAFFSHHGLSWRGIVRSLFVNLCHGRIVQGASTITQQLVKMLFYDNKRTFKRKIKEQFLTLLVEQQFSKEHILELYLNNIYLGCGIYGIGAAAQRFWGCSVAELTVEQSALLAAIICSPGHYSPLFFPYSARARRNSVIEKMRKLGFITDEQAVAAHATELGVKTVSDDLIAPHVKEYVRTCLENMVGKEQLYTGGLIIKTTLNQSMQRAAQKVFRSQCEKLRMLYGADLDGGLLSIDVKTGGIKAMVGGFDFSESQFNRALYARRQQGSIFKPLLYATAVEQGVSLLDTAIDEPFSIVQGNQQWAPRNHTRTFDGQMTLARALSYSNNVISAKLITYIGPEAMVAMAQKCHLEGPLLPYPSLALGCIDSTLQEVVGMFNIFANDGIYCKPHFISSVKDSWGKSLYRAVVEKERVVSARTAHQVAQILTAGLERRKKTARGWIDSAGLTKTGTTDDSRTCWFGGSTPEITTVVYIGCDDNRPMGKKVFPLQTSYPIWLDFHKLVPTQQREFQFDPALTKVLADWRTGEIVREPIPGREILPVLIF